MAVSDEMTLEIGDAIIQNLDEDGMLRASGRGDREHGPYAWTRWKGACNHPAPRSAGVAARDLNECLRLQLRHLGLAGSPTDIMVRDHMKKLQGHQYKRSEGRWA